MVKHKSAHMYVGRPNYNYFSEAKASVYRASNKLGECN